MDSVVHTDMFLRMVLLSLAELTSATCASFDVSWRCVPWSPYLGCPPGPLPGPPSIFIRITLLLRATRVPRYPLLFL